MGVQSAPAASTPIADVVRHYGGLQAVRIAPAGAPFIRPCDEALTLMRGRSRAWRDEADALLAVTSWDETAAAMLAAIEEVMDGSRRRPFKRPVTSASSRTPDEKMKARALRNTPA